MNLTKFTFPVVERSVAVENAKSPLIDIETVLPRKKNNKVVFFDLKPSGEYTRVVERENYKEPEEYAEIVNAE